MGKKGIILVILILIWGYIGNSWLVVAQDEQDKQQAKIEGLIKELGSEDWQKREAAQKELTQIGEKLIQEYRQTIFTTKAQRTQS